MKPKKNFERLMLNYNKRFRKDYADVDEWLMDLSSRLSVRSMSRMLKVDRTVLSRKLKEIE